MPPVVFVLAEGRYQTFDIVRWSGVLILFLLLMFAVVVAVRRYLNRDNEEAGAQSAGFTLSDLRSLHRQGRMTDDEFERAKAQMIGRAKLDAVKALESSSKRRNNDPGVPHDSAAELTAFARRLKEQAEVEEEQKVADERLRRSGHLGELPPPPP